MEKSTPEITRLIHDNLWIIVSFAFAWPAVAEVVKLQFAGDWKHLRKSMDQHAEMRADRALVEMATQLRVLDDAEDLSEIWREYRAVVCNQDYGLLTCARSRVQYP
jgi:hypothetical protein